MKASIIVCVYNGESTLDLALTSLFEQDFAGPFEIIVVNDGSTDKTQNIIDGFYKRHPKNVKIVNNFVNRGLSVSRNVGIELSVGNVVAFTDADCVAPVSWLSDLMSAWEDASPEVVGVGGIVVAYQKSTLNQKYCDAIQVLRPVPYSQGASANLISRVLNYYKFRELFSNYASSFIGANMSFRRNCLIEVGGFNPAIKFGGDEVDLAQRLCEKFGEESLLLSSTIEMSHNFHKSISDSFRRSYMYGRSDGERFAKGISGFSTSPTLILMAIAFSIFDLLLLPTGLAHLPRAALASVLMVATWLWYGITVKFKGKKLGHGTKALFSFFWLCCEILNFVGFLFGLFRKIKKSGIRNDS